MSEPIGQRWADLLYAEHVASAVLAKNGFAVARTDIMDAGNLRFLEVERFDRFSSGGRAPIISLRAILAAVLDGIGSPWSEAAKTLRDKNWLSQDDSSRLTCAWRFGKLIANTDMHDGNASLLLTPERPVRLAPVYDMLPMAYRPSNQGHVPGVSETEIAIASAATSSKEQEMAEIFWDELSTTPMVSPGFREIAGKHAKALCAPH